MVSALRQSGSGRRPRDIAPLWMISPPHIFENAHEPGCRPSARVFDNSI